MPANTSTTHEIVSTNVAVESLGDRIVVNVTGYVFQSSNNDDCIQYWVTEGTNTSFTMRSGKDGDGSGASGAGSAMTGRFLLTPGGTGTRTVRLMGRRCNTSGGEQSVAKGTELLVEVYGR